MTKDLQKKYRQDEGEKVDQNIQVLEEQFETPLYSRSWKIESSSLLQYKSSTDKFTVGFITVGRIDVGNRLEGVIKLNKFQA